MEKSWNRNPNFGVWGEDAEYLWWEPVKPLIYGRPYVMPYKERLHYLPTVDTIAGIRFENIVYPPSKRTYELIIRMARQVREEHGNAYANPHQYPLPDWFNHPQRKKYITLFRYLIAKGLRDSGCYLEKRNGRRWFRSS